MKSRIFIRNYRFPIHRMALLILFAIATKKEYETITMTKIANKLDKAVSSLQYHFTKLRKNGLIGKTNKLTEKGIKLLRYFKYWDKTFEKKLRVHKIQVVFYLAKPPKDLEKHKTSIYKPFTNKRYEGIKKELLGCMVLVYSRKKAVVNIPDICANNDEEIASALIDSVAQLREAMELEFEGLKVQDYKIAEFTSMHVAILDSIIAEQYFLEHKRWYSNGRITVDGSHGRYELEAEGAHTALEDIEVLVKYEDLAKENKLLRERIREIESLLKEFRKKKGKRGEKRGT